MKALPCPVCGYDVPLLTLEPGPMRCLHRESVFLPSSDERVGLERVAVEGLTKLDFAGKTDTSQPQNLNALIRQNFDNSERYRFLDSSHDALDHSKKNSYEVAALVVLFAVLTIATLGWFVLVYLLFVRVLVESFLFKKAISVLRDKRSDSGHRSIRRTTPDVHQLLVLWFVSSLLYAAWLLSPYLLCLFALNLGAMRLSGNAFLFLVGLPIFALAVAVGFYLHLRLWYAAFLMLDLGLDVVTAARSSWNLTRGRVAPLAGFVLLLITCNIVGGALFFVGLALSLPYTHMAQASAYLHATGQVPRAKMTS